MAICPKCGKEGASVTGGLCFRCERKLEAEKKAREEQKKAAEGRVAGREKFTEEAGIEAEARAREEARFGITRGRREAIGEAAAKFIPKVGKPFIWMILIFLVYFLLSVWPLKIIPWFGVWTILVFVIIFLLLSKQVWLVIIVLIVVVLFTGLTMWRDLSTKLEVVQETEAFKASADIGEYFKHPGKALQAWLYDYQKWKSPYVAEKEEMKGIVVESFEPRRKTYREGDPIIFDGEVHVDGLEKGDTDITFLCWLEKNKKTRVEGKVEAYGCEEKNVCSISEKASEDFDVKCELPAVEKIEEGREVEFKKAGLEVEYKDISTESSLKIYTLAKEEFKNLPNPDEPFEGKPDPLLNRKNEMRSECEDGCGLTLLALRTQEQPLTEGVGYSFEMELQKEKDWHGEIKELKEISFTKIPEGIMKISNCDFGEDMVFNKNDEPLYTEKNNQLKEALEDSEKEVDLKFFCDLEITNPRTKLDPNQIRIRAVYDYIVKKSATIEIAKKVLKDECSKDEDCDDKDETTIDTCQGTPKRCKHVKKVEEEGITTA